MERPLDVLARVAESGVLLTTTVRTVWGGKTIFLSPEQALRFAEAPEAVSAEGLGVTVEVYRNWLGHHGRVPCQARTKAGQPCRNFESGSGYDSPLEWQTAMGMSPRCAVHGGEGSD